MRPSVKKTHLLSKVLFLTRNLKTMIIERGNQKNKKVKSLSKVDLKDMWQSQISKIHRETEDSLDDSIGGLEAENTKSK